MLSKALRVDEKLRHRLWLLARLVEVDSALAASGRLFGLDLWVGLIVEISQGELVLLLQMILHCPQMLLIL